MVECCCVVGRSGRGGDDDDSVCVCVLVEVAVQAIEEDACIGTVGVQDSRTCETTLVVRGG
jgi:hypothetical protein